MDFIALAEFTDTVALLDPSTGLYWDFVNSAWRDGADFIADAEEANGVTSSVLDSYSGLAQFQVPVGVDLNSGPYNLLLFANGAGFAFAGETPEYVIPFGGVEVADNRNGDVITTPGDAMTLTGAERTAIANEVENQIIDEADSEKVLAAMLEKINASGLTTDAAIISGILAAVVSGGETVLQKLARLDVLLSSRPDITQIRADIERAGGMLALRATQTSLDDAATAILGSLATLKGTDGKALLSIDNPDAIPAIKTALTEVIDDAELGSSGGGPFELPIHIVDDTDPDPLDVGGARIRLVGNAHSYGPRTADSEGKWTFKVEADTYRILVTADGKEQVTDDSVQMDEPQSGVEKTVALETIVLPASVDADTTIGTLTVYGRNGQPVEGVEVYFRLIETPNDTASIIREWDKFTTNAQGQVSTDFMIECDWQVRIEENGPERDFHSPSTASFIIPKALGYIDR